MTFKKKYFAGTFSDLMKMVSFDAHVKDHREKSWNETKQLETGVHVMVAQSVVLPQNK